MALQRLGAFVWEPEGSDVIDLTDTTDVEPQDLDVDMKDVLEPHLPIAIVIDQDDGGQDFAELFSPPRVSVPCRQLGLKADISIDLDTGFNLDNFDSRKQVRDLLANVKFIMMSPPCTMFSRMQVCFRNFEKLSPEELEKRWTSANAYVDCSMDYAKRQVRKGQWFAYEHPKSASSWQRDSVKEVAGMDGIVKVDFDQCCLGLASPVEGRPIKKPTTIMTNSATLAALFSPLKCSCSVAHRHIEGSEGGISLSKHCQKYPWRMACLLADGVAQTLSRP